MIPFVRNELYGGDIALDFASRFIPDCLQDVEACAAGSINETVSAEAMSILQSYRIENHSDRSDIHTEDTSILLDVIREIEMKSGLFTRPKLKPEIASLVDRLSRDVFWLRNKFGVSYENIDEAIIDGEEPVGPAAHCG